LPDWTIRNQEIGLFVIVDLIDSIRRDEGVDAHRPAAFYPRLVQFSGNDNHALPCGVLVSRDDILTLDFAVNGGFLDWASRKTGLPSESFGDLIGFDHARVPVFLHTFAAADKVRMGSAVKSGSIADDESRADVAETVR
jgi:hypothetical protein